MAATMSRRMASYSLRDMLILSQLSKDEEGEETEVRREDQDKINRFSTLHQKEKLLQADLKTREVRSRLNMRVQNYMVDLYIVQKEKEDLEEVSSELELADEDEKVSYKIGDSFFLLPLPEVQELLAASIEKIDSDVTAVEEKLSELREEMQQLKTALYGRFGRSINLEA
ncbi:Prefoldin, subunit 4 [Aureobasidium pullulans]|uniref:Prefoldin, subunit 4 n=1 Tax=Aureobasidium pullulans TaxID=5580 RepID=A0A4S8VTE9_AURPU|nr:Prefoldin, subunit 4 [Aureobasidium pullulans]THY07891.1 Prefoldin, subunit 4 [Aureobasidium pullulans]THY64422.1 Prefoldin, subunit 4 [Aureobasidium pullulans]THZ25040.1 Prefoldin, subunit 4 [Aureobasidium pullulans]